MRAPTSYAARNARIAISPRLATSTLENMARRLPRRVTRPVVRRSGGAARLHQRSRRPLTVDGRRPYEDGSDQELLDQPGHGVGGRPRRVSGTSSTVTHCRPPAVVATSEVSPARRWNQVERDRPADDAVAVQHLPAPVQAARRATRWPSARACPSAAHAVGGRARRPTGGSRTAGTATRGRSRPARPAATRAAEASRAGTSARVQRRRAGARPVADERSSTGAAVPSTSRAAACDHRARGRRHQHRAALLPRGPARSRSRRAGRRRPGAGRAARRG